MSSNFDSNWPEPADANNAVWNSLVKPADWRNPEPAARYNLVVIGAGTAGLVTAAAAAGLGAKVALVERNRMGGDCLNTGCVPSKTLIRSARAAAAVREAGRFGVRRRQHRCGSHADPPVGARRSPLALNCRQDRRSRHLHDSQLESLDPRFTRHIR
jgi:cation diffusion facilitator CzcD-associated flavoprotein CzcO